jgi:uncharacterized membrane protein SpoIIM required for sporulation
MVLEALLNPQKAERKPWELFFLGLVYASVAFILSYWVFRDYISIVMVSLTAICSVPFVYNIIKLEENKDEESRKEYWLIKEHVKAVSALTFLFIGFVTAFLIWFIVLPGTTAENVFSAQIKTISDVTSDATTQMPTASLVSSLDEVIPILMNNLKILIFCFILSVFFGAGAIFVLTWNASVVAVAIGVFVRNELLTRMGASVAEYSHILSLGVLKYLTHGIFEIVAYFVCALAGGIISVAVIRHEFNSPGFRQTILDSTDLTAIAIILLIIAAVVEVFVTPILL